MNIKEYIKDGMQNGFKLPYAYDGSTKQPSVTLWFAYCSFFLAFGAVVYFIVKGDPLASSSVAIGFWALAMVFYRLRHLDKFKLDLDDKSLELSGDEDEESEDK